MNMERSDCGGRDLGTCKTSPMCRRCRDGIECRPEGSTTEGLVLQERFGARSAAYTVAEPEVKADWPFASRFAEIVRDVSNEMTRQDQLKAEGRFKYHCGDDEMTDLGRYAVIGEEVGEVARVVLENDDLANDKHGKNLRKELVQVAAVCMKWIEGMDRRAAEEKLRHVFVRGFDEQQAEQSDRCKKCGELQRHAVHL